VVNDSVLYVDRSSKLGYPLLLTAVKKVIHCNSLQLNWLSIMVHSSESFYPLWHTAGIRVIRLWITAVNQVIRFGSGNHFKIE
jgi:hypothetical protein